MKDLLRPIVVWCWVLAVVLGAAAVIVFVLSGQTADEQAHRAQVWGTLVATLAIVPPALMWAWRHALPKPKPPEVSSREQVSPAAPSGPSWSGSGSRVGPVRSRCN